MPSSPHAQEHQSHKQLLEHLRTEDARTHQKETPTSKDKEETVARW